MYDGPKCSILRCQPTKVFIWLCLFGVFFVIFIYIETKSFKFNKFTKKIQNAPQPSNNTDSLPLLLESERKVGIQMKIAQTFKQITRPMTCVGCMDVNFQFSLDNRDTCRSKNKSIDLVILITSSPNNFVARDTLRKTWLTHSRHNIGKIRYVFLVGNSIKDEAIRMENELKHDIILGNFTDAYSNLTLKVLMGFKWTLQFCENAKFIMKTDDDVYVNIPALLTVIHKNEKALQSSVGGSCCSTALPIRNKWSKWYVSEAQFPQKTYPGFCSGTGYVTSKNVVSKIVNISKIIPFFHLEDVYISLCVKAVGYRLLPLKGFVNRPKYEPCLYKDNVSLVTAHQVPLQWMKYIWNTPCLLSKNKVSNS